MSNINGEEGCVGRGNLSFTSINLPYLALEAKGKLNKFYSLLDDYLEIALSSLLERYNLQKSMKVKNFPFLMGQHLYMNSDHLGPEDTVEDAIKNGTLSMGFIGLAETLICLTGKHHGESEKSQKLGLEIIQRIKDFCDKKTKELSLNVTLLATPAETYCMRAMDVLKKNFGIIENITDREYLTNSCHVPVWYNITFKNKMKIEGAYHKMCNAGAIAYLEADGDISQNLDAFEAMIHSMADSDVIYGAINVELYECTICGASWRGETHICPRCGRDEREPIEL